MAFLRVKGRAGESPKGHFRCKLSNNEHTLCERFNMPQAMMDPEQVRRFAEELQRFNRDLQNRMGSLQARFSSLGESWQDQEHTKFSDEFKQTAKTLKKFMEMSDQHVPYLLRKAQRIEEYLKQR